MKVETIFLIYLLIINLLNGIIFANDKRAAMKNCHRTPERTLHILEMMGGVFANFLLMYSIHHKNRKFRYYGVTWVVMMGWVIILFMNLQNAFS
jgi:uncharacterized membrane protein YsdA (DUF1294 family)